MARPDGPFPLEPPLTIAELTEHQEQIRGALRGLESRYSGSLYFPFFWWGSWQQRPMQYYLNKLPHELRPHLNPPPPWPTAAGVAGTGPTVVLGTDYRPAQVSTSPSTAGSRSPSIPPSSSEASAGTSIPRTNSPHVLRDAGSRHAPASQANQTLIGLGGNGTVFVAEIKSITDDNEEEQLRLGLGQVLRYRRSSKESATNASQPSWYLSAHHAIPPGRTCAKSCT